MALGEALNVGVLFYFPNSNNLFFYSDTPTRVKSVYKKFDSSAFKEIVRGIELKVKDQNHLFRNSELESFKTKIHALVLNEDSTALQFTVPKTAVHAFKSDEEAKNSYIKILFPNSVEHEGEPRKHSETYLIKKYTDLIFGREQSIKDKITRNKKIETDDVSLKFEIAWKNGSLNLVKPISFDLQDEISIQNKSTQYFGYLTLLTDYAKKEHCRFDLLIARPQTKSLFKAYDKALEILKEAKAPKKIVTEDTLKAYSEETIRELLAH